MKKLNFFTFLVSLVVIGFMSSCSSTKYGAHFQPSNYQPHVYNQQQNKPAEAAPEGVSVAEVTHENQELTIERATPEFTGTEIPAPLASVKGVSVAKEVPTIEKLTGRQEEVIEEVKERLDNMTRQEKRELREQIRELRLSEHTKNLSLNNELNMEDIQQETTVNIVALILAIVLPPLGVFVHQGEINSKFWISLLLTILFFIPGVIYSVLVVLGIV